MQASSVSAILRAPLSLRGRLVGRRPLLPERFLLGLGGPCVGRKRRDKLTCGDAPLLFLYEQLDGLCDEAREAHAVPLREELRTFERDDSYAHADLLGSLRRSLHPRNVARGSKIYYRSRRRIGRASRAGRNGWLLSRSFQRDRRGPHLRRLQDQLRRERPDRGRLELSACRGPARASRPCARDP